MFRCRFWNSRTKWAKLRGVRPPFGFLFSIRGNGRFENSHEFRDETRKFSQNISSSFELTRWKLAGHNHFARARRIYRLTISRVRNECTEDRDAHGAARAVFVPETAPRLGVSPARDLHAPRNVVNSNDNLSSDELTACARV